MRRARTAPFLGAIKLNWCDNCNLPILDKTTCGLCGGKAHKVPISPPGDVRPAFESDIVRLSAIIDEIYGKGSSEALGLVKYKLVLLNEVSYDDLMEEIIIDGNIVGSIRYNLFLEDWDFIPKFIGAKRIFESKESKKKFVVVDDGAVNYIENGYNVLAPGITDIDENLRKGESAVALAPDGRVLSIGIMRVSTQEFKKMKKGVVLKAKHHLSDFDLNINTELNTESKSWEEAVEANKLTIEQYEKRALNAIIKTREKLSHLPLSVSFSGGKDSLVCLNLVSKIPNTEYKVLFANTGLEFDETVSYIEEIIEELDLKNNFCRKDVPKEKFWTSVENFGPPGKDYRYCCKLQKIGPINELIEEFIGEKTLSIIGQRAYESLARSKSKTLWSNPWIPNQINFTPIQKWTALHVWLYIFKEKLHYNSLYEQGLSRIGCWLCPASNQATFHIVKDFNKDLWEKWMGFLQRWKEKNNLPEEWITWGLWRWKKLPKKIIDLAAESGVNLDYTKREEKKLGDWQLKFTLAEGYATCKSGDINLEGLFNLALDLQRLEQFWSIFGEVDYDEDLGILTVITESNNVVALSADGILTAKGKSVKKVLKKLVLEVFRSEECTGCETCLSHCINNAIAIQQEIKQVEIDITKCNQCEECHNRCPVIKFGHREIEELFS